MSTNNNSSSSINNTSNKYTRVSLGSSLSSSSSTSDHGNNNSHDATTSSTKNVLSIETQQQSSTSVSTTTTSNDPFAPRNLSSTTTATATSNDNITNRTIQEKIMDKVFAALWVIVAYIIIHYTNSLYVFYIINDTTTTTSSSTDVAVDHRANIYLMQIIMIGLGINTVLTLYLLLYLPYIKGLYDTSCYDVYCPRIIPIMSLIGFIIYILLIRATWHIWGFLSPIIISIEGMGILYATHFIPIRL